ncbi:RICIN domain-containing protein [Streptomyces sp. NPDC046324]|uniref:RICIN domain-containing protein n=1 Tax=Streptomyces sp. NPDC046324 TaxID=3154915 RepID=UPI0033E66DD9
MIKQVSGRTAVRLAVAASALVLGVATASPAQAAAKVAASSDVVHSQSGKCLDGSLSQGVRLVTCDGGAYQRWTYSGDSLVHAQSGRCLDASVSQGVRLIVCDGGSYQKWDTNIDGELRHRQSGRCLDGSVSQGVRILACNGTSYQWWYGEIS